MSTEPTITLTLDQLRDLLRGEQATSQEALTVDRTKSAQSRYVIVRGDRSGVFCGVLISEEGRTVELTECRHVWYWSGAANVAEMSLTGVSKPNECKVLAPVQRLRVLDTIEIVDCTAAAEISLRTIPIWSKK